LLLEHGVYRFDPVTIVEVRQRLRLSQTDLAQLLGIPSNTLSRWETGKTTPDANSLASIYTVAQNGGLNVNFFSYSVPGRRNRLVIALDFQNVALASKSVAEMDRWLMSQLQSISPQCEFELFKAFCRPDQAAAIEELRKLKWKTRVKDENIDSVLVQECKNDCGQNPDDTTLVLCSKDGDFSGLVEEMRTWGVRVLVIGPANTSLKLRTAAGNDFIQMPHFIGSLFPISTT